MTNIPRAVLSEQIEEHLGGRRLLAAVFFNLFREDRAGNVRHRLYLKLFRNSAERVQEVGMDPMRGQIFLRRQIAGFRGQLHM